MKLFLETADVRVLRSAVALGCVDGVATTAALLGGLAREREDVLQELCGAFDGPVLVQAFSTTATGLVAEAGQLAALHPNLVLQVPMGLSGLEAITALTAEGSRTGVACRSANQALLCMKAGATWVMPSPAEALVRDVVSLIRSFGSKTQVLVSAVEQPEQVRHAALLGADGVTVSFELLRSQAGEP